MRNHNGIGYAPNLTNPFLCMAGVLLFCAVFAIYSLHGVLGVTLFALGLDHIIMYPKRVRQEANPRK